MSKRPALTVYCPERHLKKLDRKVMYEFGRELAKELSKNEDGVQMPRGFGRIMIAGFMFNTRDYQQDQNVLYRNSHTEGLVYIPYYMPKFNKYVKKKKRPFIYCDMYKVQMYKPFRRALARQIKSGNYKHFQTYEYLADVNKTNCI